MTANDISKLINTSQDYDFLRTNPHLGDNVIMLGLGGSYAYGTNTENSDIDIRGIALNSKGEILLGRDFEQVVHMHTDTTIYSIRKIFTLLASCNPNTIELLGLEDNQILKHDNIVWPMIEANKDAFLSKICIHSFGGYANAQLRRLENKTARLADQAKQEQHILDSIRFAEEEFRRRYPEADIRIFIDKSAKEDMESELFINANLMHYPLRDFHAFLNEYHGVIRSYEKIGKRNQNAIEHGKLGKHMMHLVRLYLMVFDILEKGEIRTYRKNEHDLLMAIRNGKYLDANRQPTQEFYDLVDTLDERLKKDAEATKLPDKPDYERINQLLVKINKRVVCGAN